MPNGRPGLRNPCMTLAYLGRQTCVWVMHCDSSMVTQNAQVADADAQVPDPI